jgi:hypothetical protein
METRRAKACGAEEGGRRRQRSCHKHARLHAWHIRLAHLADRAGSHWAGTGECPLPATRRVGAATACQRGGSGWPLAHQLWVQGGVHPQLPVVEAVHNIACPGKEQTHTAGETSTRRCAEVHPARRRRPARRQLRCSHHAGHGDCRA